MDAYNNPVWGVGMTFTAPTSGPSGTFSSGTSTITVVTGSDGVASAPFTANQIPGSYLVFASATSEAEPKSSPYRANASAEEVALSPVSFSLTNTGYALSASPNFFSVAQGYSGTSTITSTVVEFSSPVTLSASGQPAGVNVTFSPASITSAGTSTMTVTVASTTATGSYPITITGASGNTTNKTTFTLTVTSLISGGPPAIVSLSPNSGSGTSVEFKAVYSNPNGAGDLSEVLLQINSSQSSAGACYVYYQQQGNHLYLANNAGNAWMTPALTPGAAGMASNSQCSLNAGSGSVTAAGDDLTLNVALSFSGTFVGEKNVYLYAAGLSGQHSGWVKEGTWVPTSAGPPAIVSLSQNTGAATSVTFKAVYSDPNGAGDLNELLLQVNASQSNANACYVYYQPQGNHLYLATNAGAWITPALTPGVAGTASNSQCTLNAGSSSVTTAGNDLTLNVALTFSSTFVGAKNLYLYAAGLSAQNSGWVKEGTWVPTSAGPPAIVSLSPNSGTGTSVTFKAVYSDPNGSTDLNEILLQMNASQSGANACYVYYQPQGNLLYLANNAGTAWMTPALTPGVAGTASNGQCTLNAGSSSVTTAGNDLTLSVALSFSGTFTGAKNVYLYAAGISGQNTGWVKEGAWTP